MDQSWMNASCISHAYEEGIEQFFEFSFKRSWPDKDEKYFCPCINRLNGRQQVLDNIEEHIMCDGIKKNYTTLIWHGELTDTQKGSQTEPVDVEMGDRL